MAQEDKFVKGCAENNIDEELARKIFGLMLQFASYGFNKSHSAAYAFVAYQTAYLKAHYPCEYMAAYMSHIKAGKPEVKAAKLATAKRVCESYGIKFLGVDVNKSEADYVPEGDNCIRIGFSAIKGMGDSVIDSIIGARKQDGDFESPTDFLYRVATYDDGSGNDKSIGLDAFTALCRLGAFNSIYGEQEVLCTYSENIVNGIKRVVTAHKKAKKKEESDMSINLFDMSVLEELKVKPPKVEETLPIPLRKPPKYTDRMLMDSERELYSFYATKNPLDEFRKDYIVGVSTDVDYMVKAVENGSWNPNWKAKECGMFTEMKAIVTKKGDPMAFGKFQTYSECLDVVIFPRVFAKMQQNGILNKFVYFIKEATPALKDGRFQLVIDDIEALA